MKIKVLGSSSGWALPRIGCSCKICSSTNQKDKRSRPSILINDSILIDAGPDVYHQFLRLEISKVDSIVLTHSHPDHIFGLHDLIPKKFKAMKGVPIHGSEKTWTTFNRLFPNAGYKKEIFEEYIPFEAGGLKFTPVPVVHSKSAPTVGFVIEDGNSILCYFSDFRSFSKEEDKKYFEGVDCLFLDGSVLKNPFPVWTNKWGHISIIEGIKLATECRTKKTIFTHIGHRTIPHDDLSELLRKKGEFYPAFDGMDLQV
nr:MBL fold metallo-hydrolase [Candidatus Freyarchaeota archaeon]